MGSGMKDSGSGVRKDHLNGKNGHDNEWKFATDRGEEVGVSPG